MSDVVSMEVERHIKEIVHEEIATAFLRVRYWIVVSVLVNITTMRLPAVVVGALYYSQVETTSALAVNNADRLNSRTRFIENTDRRMVSVEKFLEKEYGYQKPAELPFYK